MSFPSSLSIHNLFREFISNSLFFPEFTLKSLSFSRIHFEFKISFSNSLWTHFHVREFTRNSLSLQIHFESTISFANSDWIPYLFHEFTTNSLFFRESTLNSLSFLQIHYLFRRFIYHIEFAHIQPQIWFWYWCAFYSGIHQLVSFLSALKTIWLERPWSIKWYTKSSLPIFDHKIWFWYGCSFL